jgi:hypothetical protein
MAEAQGRAHQVRRDSDDKESKWYSLGSVGHADRTCKPCAFFHAQGCQSGKDCQFCHLCPPREVQRRKRMRRRVAREQEQQRMLQAMWGGQTGNDFEHLTSNIMQSMGVWNGVSQPAWEPEPEDNRSSGTSTPPTESGVGCSAMHFGSAAVSRTTSSASCTPTTSNGGTAAASTCSPAIFTVVAVPIQSVTCIAQATPAPCIPTQFTISSIGTAGTPACNAQELEDSEPGSPSPFRCITDFMDVAVGPLIWPQGLQPCLMTPPAEQVHQVVPQASSM